MKVNIVADKKRPISQATFFCAAPTYSGVWFLTAKRPSINVGEYLGLIKTRMAKSVKKMVIKYLTIKKSLLYRICISEMIKPKNRIPADALISRSFKTGILYPCTFSPNCITFFMVLGLVVI